MLECIENMSKLHNDMRWIPVTERLPEDFVDVLVWFEYRCIEDDSLIKKLEFLILLRTNGQEL